MPDTLSLSAGVSLGLLAGIVSGVCYLFANGITWPNVEPEKKRCLPLSSDDGVCRKCGGDTQGGLVPCICRYHKPVKFESGAWFLRQVQRAVSLMPWSLTTDKLAQIEEECEEKDNPGPSQQRRSDLRNVREFLETLSASLAGGTLEGTRVSPLYDHPAYHSSRSSSPSRHKQSEPTLGASSAHAQLKRLVARVVEEAASMPALARYACEPAHTPSLESSTYEDLLATAILNKVIERYQTENGSGGRSSGIHSASASPTPTERSSPRSLHSTHARNITPPLREEEDVSDWDERGVGEDAVDYPRRVPFPEFGGDIVHHDSNEDDFDDVSGSDIQAVDGSWEENWLFQKKKIKTIQSVPVPMLVPNSNTDYRVLIGDRDADDTTDLSDNASEAEENDEEYKGDIKRVLESKHIIGGKSKAEDIIDFEPDSLTVSDSDEKDRLNENIINDKIYVDAINKEINDNYLKKKTPIDKVSLSKESGQESILVLGIDSGPLPKAEFALTEAIHRTVLNGDSLINQEDLKSKTDSEEYKESNDSLLTKNGLTPSLSIHEREGEYEETVTIPVQRYADSLRRKHFEDEPQQIPTRDTDADSDLIPGSIAYRERKKWLNYVEMPNNPYSPEAIQKRLQAKSTSNLFDMITSKCNETDEDQISQRDRFDRDRFDRDSLEKEDPPVKEKKNLSVNQDKIFMIDAQPKTPTSKLLKEHPEEMSQYKKYGRDYYVKEAKTPLGVRKKNSLSDTSSVSSMKKSMSIDNFDTEFASPGLLISQFNKIATNQQYTKFAVDDPTPSITTIISNNNKNEVIIEYEDVDEKTLFTAQPAIVDDDTDQTFDEIIHSAHNADTPPPLNVDVNKSANNIAETQKSPNNLSVDNSYVSSSSMDDSIKIYNVQSGEIVKSKSEDNILSLRYVTPDKNDNIDIKDKNIPGGTSDKCNRNGDMFPESVYKDLEEDKAEKNELDDILPQLPKVKELAKIFVSMDNLNGSAKQPKPISKRRKSREDILNDETKSQNKQTYMHSLTARSISREFREELKLSLAKPLTVPGGSKEIPEGEEVVKESSRPGSPLPEPGTIKTKLAFFESLRAKFSSNK